MAKRIRRGVFGFLLVAVCGLALYEGWRVWVAQRHLEAAFAPYSVAAGNDILRWRDLSPWQQNALIRVQDPDFFNHNGFDIWTAGAGLTTITQAITKKLFFPHFRPGFAKIEQSLIARFVISPNISKEEQLTAFLNVVYLGERDGTDIIGFRMAAQTYFQKDVPDLGEEEFLRLVGALIAPRTYPPIPGNTESDARLARLERYVAGECTPVSNRDVMLSGCDISQQ